MIEKYIGAWHDEVPEDREKCVEYAKGMAGKSIASRRDGQPDWKVVQDHQKGKRAEFAYWRGYCPDSNPPDVKVYENRRKVKFDKDVGGMQVKLISRWKGSESWVFQLKDIENGSGMVALVEDCDGDWGELKKFRLAYTLTYEDARELAKPMKVAKYARKRAIYREDIEASLH